MTDNPRLDQIKEEIRDKQDFRRILVEFNVVPSQDNIKELIESGTMNILDWKIYHEGKELGEITSIKTNVYPRKHQI